MNTTKLKLKCSISERRYNHCLRVAELAQTLAARFGEDAEKAYLAGLLHDCAKDLSDQEMIRVALEAGLAPDAIQCEQPIPLLHAQVGAYLAQRDYCIDDKSVLQAIRYHQSGGVNMTSLDKIVSLADMTDPVRTEPDLEDTRRLLETDLNEAYFQRYSLTIIKLLKESQIYIDKSTAVYNHLLLCRLKQAGSAI